MKYDVLKTEFEIIVSPKNTRCAVLVDDTLRNFSANHNTLGLLPAKHEHHFKLTYFARKLWNKYFLELEKSYVLHSGISAKGFQLLSHTIKLLNVSVVVLDWDKTLTYHSSFKLQPCKAYAECLFGGYNRMKEIRKFFRQLHRNGTPTFILTNNPRAKHDSSSFSNILKYVGGSWVPVLHTGDTKMTYMKKVSWI